MSAGPLPGGARPGPGADEIDAALSVHAAAREAPDRLALHTEAGPLRFAELAARVRQRQAELAPVLAGQRFHAMVGQNTLDTLLTLYALLALRVPALLLHPKLTAAEQAAEVQATKAAAQDLPPDAAVVLYTSGTTGRSRGAVLTRAALLASATASAANLGWEEDDCWGLVMPVARVGGLSIVTRCLIARRAVALLPPFDAQQLPGWLARWRVTQLSLVPTMLALVLDAHPDGRAPEGLRVLLLGGSASSPSLRARAAAAGWPVVLTYGCTETCSQVVATPYAQRFDPAAAGTVLPGAELRIDAGRILVRGPMRMAGYLGQPPLAPADWFDTGDLGEIDAQGGLHVHARRTDLIVTGGENVYPVEVEQVLEACPGVRAAAVFGLPDPVWGQTVAAALVLEPPASDDAELRSRLAAHLAAQLARHKRPRSLCTVAALPLTPAGKPDRAALPALAPALRPLR